MLPRRREANRLAHLDQRRPLCGNDLEHAAGGRTQCPGAAGVGPIFSPTTAQRRAILSDPAGHLARPRIPATALPPAIIAPP